MNFWTEEILDNGILHLALCVSPSSKMRQLKSLKRWDESSPNSCFQTEIENKLSLFLNKFCTLGSTQPHIHYFPLLWAHNNTAHTAVLLGGVMGLTLSTGMGVHHLPLSLCSRIWITHSQPRSENTYSWLESRQRPLYIIFISVNHNCPILLATIAVNLLLCLIYKTNFVQYMVIANYLSALQSLVLIICGPLRGSCSSEGLVQLSRDGHSILYTLLGLAPVIPRVALSLCLCWLSAEDPTNGFKIPNDPMVPGGSWSSRAKNLYH